MPVAPAWHNGQTNSIIEISSSSLKFDFPIVELQKRGISLFSLRKRAKGCLISKKRAFAHFGPNNTLRVYLLSQILEQSLTLQFFS